MADVMMPLNVGQLGCLKALVEKEVRTVERHLMHDENGAYLAQLRDLNTIVQAEVAKVYAAAGALDRHNAQARHHNCGPSRITQ